MASTLFCGGCGKGNMQPLWKHCPYCGFKVLVPELNCQFPGLSKEEQPAGWNPLFLKASDIADQLISEGLAQTKLELADPEWGQDWIDEFNHNHYGVAYVINGEGNADFALDLVITGETTDTMLKEKFTDLDEVQVRLVDDGWYVEVHSFTDAWQEEEKFAKTLQENYGGEIFIAKPKKKKKAEEAE